MDDQFKYDGVKNQGVKNDGKNRKASIWGGIFAGFAVVVAFALLVTVWFYPYLKYVIDGETIVISEPNGQNTPKNIQEFLDKIGGSANEATVEPTPVPTPYVTRQLPKIGGEIDFTVDINDPIADIVQNVSRGVVGLHMYAKMDGEIVPNGGASGIVITEDGYIVTNYHVIEGADSIFVQVVGDKDYEAEIIGSDPSNEVAVIKIDTKGLKPAKLGDSSKVRIGETAIVIGNQLGAYAGTVTTGVISAKDMMYSDVVANIGMLQTDAPINFGNSGGALVNRKGEIIGMPTMKKLLAGFDDYGNPVSAEGVGYAIPINEVVEIVEKLIVNGRIDRPAIGVTVGEISETVARENGIVPGLYVSSLEANGPADKAGIKINDVIIGANGVSIVKLEDFLKFVQGNKVGDKVTLRLWREGSEIEVEAIVGDMNSIRSSKAASPIK